MKRLEIEANSSRMSRRHLRHALRANAEYQQTLQEILVQIEERITTNQEGQKRLKQLIQHMLKAPKKGGVGLGGRRNSAFTLSDGSGPPDNIETRKKQSTRPPTFKTKRWSDQEREALLNGVCQKNQERMLNAWEDEYKKKNGHPPSLSTYDEYCNYLRDMDKNELAKNYQGIDWESLAKSHVPGRRAAECKIQWLQNDHPDISNSNFTPEEDKMLLKLAHENGAHSWEKIAMELGTNRTPHQCLSRYQRSLNANLMKSKWKPEDDQKLKAAVQKYGEKNWQEVANCLEGRTGQQCLHRWQKSQNPRIRRGRWTAEEDKKLEIAVKVYGNKNWVRVQQHVPGRTDVQCRERFMNILNPELNNGKWTTEEDQMLVAAVEANGIGKWAQIAKLIPSRTDNQCWRRWKAIKPQETVDAYRRTLLKKNKGLVKNFVGREKERPKLTAEDFEIDGEEQLAKTPARRKAKSALQIPQQSAPTNAIIRPQVALPPPVPATARSLRATERLLSSFLQDAQRTRTTAGGAAPHQDGGGKAGDARATNTDPESQHGEGQNEATAAANTMLNFFTRPQQFPSLRNIPMSLLNSEAFYVLNGWVNRCFQSSFAVAMTIIRHNQTQNTAITQEASAAPILSTAIPPATPPLEQQPAPSTTPERKN